MIFAITSCGGGGSTSPTPTPTPTSTPIVSSKWSILNGFPVSYFSGAGFSPEGAQNNFLIENIDGMDGLEILVAGTATPGNSSIHIFKNNGEPLSGWPSDLLPTGTAPFVVANFGEKVVVGGTNTVENDLFVYAADYLGFPLSYWTNVPVSFVGQYPSAFDIDNDGIDEIFVGDESAQLLALDYIGNVLPGWNESSYREICLDGSGQSTKAIAFGDLNEDSKVEVLAVSGNLFSSLNHCLLAFQLDGSQLDGFPIVIPGNGRHDFSIAVGNVDSDAALEIVYVQSGRLAGINPELYVYGNDGLIKYRASLSGDLLFSGASPVLADLDGDTVNEIIVLGNGTLNVTRGNGDHFPGFPIVFGRSELSSLGNCGVVVGDINGDTEPEIVFCAIDLGDVSTWAVSTNGEFLEDSPLISGENATGSPRGPAIADVDNDGQNEIVVGNSNKIWVYRYGENVPSGDILWGQYGKDSKRTNLVR